MNGARCSLEPMEKLSYPAPSGFVCTCLAGYQGPLCELDVDECWSNPCMNGGTCITPRVAMYECVCSPGWRGEQCQEGEGGIFVLLCNGFSKNDLAVQIDL